MKNKVQFCTAPRISKVILHSQLSIDEQREIYESILEQKKEYGDFRGFNEHLEFDEKIGIKGSNLPYLVLANKFLAKKGKRTPTSDEAMLMDKADLLTKGVYREFGIAVYSASGPNEDLANPLATQAKKRNLEFPILVHPISLDINKKNGEYGFGEDDSFIIHGEEARESLEKFNYKSDSGVRRLGRDGGGIWCADWGDPFDSGSVGRVDWACAEGMRANLEDSLKQEINEESQRQAEKVLEDINSKREQAFAIIRGNN